MRNWNNADNWLEETLFSTKGFWSIFYDEKADENFLRNGSKFSDDFACISSGNYLMKREVGRDPEKFGCIYLGRL